MEIENEEKQYHFISDIAEEEEEEWNGNDDDTQFRLEKYHLQIFNQIN